MAYSFTKFLSLVTQVGLAFPLSSELRYRNSLFKKTILAKICILFRSLTFGRTKKRFLWKKSIQKNFLTWSPLLFKRVKIGHLIVGPRKWRIAWPKDWPRSLHKRRKRRFLKTLKYIRGNEFDPISLANSLIFDLPKILKIT